MTVALIIIAALFFLFIIYSLVLIRPRLYVWKKFRQHDSELFTDYAHRGLHGGSIPENSLAAFALAAEKGHGVELDVQLSKDGKVMVFHDYSLSRMTGRDALLSDLTADELKELRLAGTDEKIPYLTEVLDTIGGRVPILVELKGESTDTSVCPPTNEILSSYKGKYCVESFNPILLRWYRKNRPDVMRGILVTNAVKEKKKLSLLNFALTNLLTNILCRPDFVAYDIRYGSLSNDICTKCYDAPAFAWTVRNEDDYYKAREYGANVIFERIKPE